jgi:outer membrane protein OmpA-like peptidoglycan-associated protein
MLHDRRFDFRHIAVLALVALVSISCKTTPKSADPPPIPDLATVMPDVARDVGRQLGRSTGERTLAIDPLIDPVGQQTNATRRVQTEFAAALPPAARGVTIVPFTSENIDQSKLIGTGTLEPAGEVDLYKLNLSITDRASGLVIAHTVARFRQPGLDTTPTPFYAEAPSSVIDRPTTGYIATANTETGKPADAVYIDQIPTAALLTTAISAEEAGRYQEALDSYAKVAARRDGQLPRTFQGLYLTNMHLGRTAPAEEAFSKIVALGLATNTLQIKFLFQPNTTTFVQGTSASAVYPMWLRQIARAAQANKTCFNIVGHSSKTGTAELNRSLSLRRADSVQSQLPTDLRRSSCTIGMGFDQTLIGSGTDDARDALDRRVEFEVVACTELKCTR